MAEQKQSDRLVGREVELHFCRGMGPPGEAKTRSFLFVLPVQGVPRRSCCQRLAAPEKAARPDIGEEWLWDTVA